MAHLLDTYSRTGGLRIEEMRLTKHFFPLPFEGKYMIVVNSSGMAAKSYDYFSEALLLIKKGLAKAGIKIVQLGGKEDQPLDVDVNLCGKTSFSQFFYLVSNSVLCLSGDTSVVHIAGHYSIPIVALYGITHPNVSGSFFGDKSKQHYLIPPGPDFKPTYNPNEYPKKVNQITPERVASKVGEVLEIEVDQIETINIGYKYTYLSFHLVPNVVVSPNSFQGAVPFVRYDFGGEEDKVYENLNVRPCRVLTNKPLDVSKLVMLKKHIVELIYIIEDNHSVEFVQKLSQAGINYTLTTFQPKEWLDEVKLDYLDFKLIVPQTYSVKSDVPNIEKVNSKTRFKTHKFILSEGKIFLSKAHYLAGIETPNMDTNEGELIDSTKFWRDHTDFYLFNKK